MELTFYITFQQPCMKNLVGVYEMTLIVAIGMCMIIVIHYSMSRVININDVHTTAKYA